MKKIVIPIIIMAAANLLHADRIYLRDATIAEGKIIQITSKSVEYDPLGDASFDALPREEVVKIEYDDGKTVRFLFDTVTLHDGSRLKGEVNNVDAEYISFTPDGEDKQQEIPRDIIQTITFSDGREIGFAESDLAETAADETPHHEEAKQERIPGFHKSIVRVSAYIGGFEVKGPLIDREERLIGMYGEGGEIHRTAWAWGIDLDIMLPALEFSQTRGFSFTGIKFGIRGRYGCTYVDTGMYYNLNYFGTAAHVYNEERFLSMSYWCVGPVVDFIISSRQNWVNMSIQAFALGGTIINGRLRPGATLADAGINFPGGADSIGMEGYTFRFGVGPHLILNRWVPLDIGINPIFSWTYLTLDRPVNAYNSGRRKHFLGEMVFEVVLGFHY